MTGVFIVRFSLTLCMIYLLQLVMCTEMIPERTEVIYVNEKYLVNTTLQVRRTGRRSPYYVHLEGTTLDWAGDNVTIRYVFFEYLHNEYKRSFVEFELTLCTFFNKEPWYSMIGAVLKARGYVCPAPPGVYKLHNLTVSLVNFPYVVPYERAMVEGCAKLTTTQEIIAKGRLYMRFKRDVSVVAGSMPTRVVPFLEIPENDLFASSIGQLMIECKKVAEREMPARTIQ